MGKVAHQIEAIWYDEDAGCAIWRCRCGYDSDGYASVTEARYAAVEHQLPESVQRDLDERGYGMEEWRDAVLFEAPAEAAEDPQGWRWYRESG